MGKTIYVCYKCGSKDVQERQWVYTNTETVVGWDGTERQDRWCPNCQEHCDIVSEEEFVDHTTGEDE